MKCCICITVVPAGTIQLADGTTVTQGLQTLTMTNASPTASNANSGGTTIVQYTQGPDGQFYIPGKPLFRHTSLHMTDNIKTSCIY